MSKWEMVKLRDVCDVRDGTHDSPKYVANGYPLVTSKNVTNGYIDITDVNYISIEDYKKIIVRSGVNDGDIIMPMIGTIGNPVVVQKTFDFAIKNVALIKFVGNSVYNKYIYYILASSIFKKYIEKENRGGTQKFISLSNIRNFSLPFPPLETQRQIAKTLDTAAELLALRKQQLAELGNLINSTFYDMFGDPVANEKRWVVEKLMDVATKIGSGATPKGGKESYQDDGISLIRSMNVHNGLFKYEQLAHINDEQAKQLNNVVVRENDVLINITGASVARSCIVPSGVLPARVNQHVSIVRLNEEKANPEYINNMFISNSFQTRLLSIGGAGGATREAITKQQLQDLVIPLPPLPLQIHFSSVVTKIEEQKALVKKAIDETQYLFDSLMSEYFD